MMHLFKSQHVALFVISSLMTLGITQVNPTVASAIVLPPPSGSGDFVSRCQALGVIKCFAFDDQATTDPFVFPPSGQTQKRGMVVSDIKASGAGSLRFTIPSNSGSDSSGAFWQNFSDDLSVQFGEGGEFYVQWRQRFSPEFLNTKYTGGGGWKQLIIGEGDRPGEIQYSCTQLEIVTQNTLQRRFAQMYHSCGGKDDNYEGLEVPVPPYDFALQNAIDGCLYSTQSVPPCVGYQPNQWMTFQVHVKIGTWYKNDKNYHKDSTVELWIAEEGQPSRLVISRTDYDIANTENLAAKYGKLWLTPYHTGKSSAQSHPTGYVWYDDLIISTNKIADPDGSAAAAAAGGGGGGVGSTPVVPPSPDLIAPGAPTNLRVAASAPSGATSGGSGVPSSPPSPPTPNPSSAGGTSSGLGASPSYISSMAAYEVRNLEGPLAPGNGTLSMQSITPSEWLTNDPSVSLLKGVIVAWSGGAKGIGARLMVHGGGHHSSANNGLYIFDFDGTDRPNGWVTPLVVSHVADVTQSSHTYADGNPTAVHTYDGMVHAHHNNHLYRFMGSQYDNGFMTSANFKFNLATNHWTQLPNFPGTTGGAKTIYDPVSGNIFVTRNDVFEGYFFRTATDTWSGIKSYGGNGFPFNGIGAWDSSRNRGIIVGDNELSVLALDFTNETVAVSTFTPSGATEIFGQSGLSVFYDAQRDVYWLFGGFPNSPGWTNLYEMQAGSWAVTRHALAGASIFREPLMRGSFGRFVFMDQWRAIGIVASHTSPVSVIKLP